MAVAGAIALGGILVGSTVKAQREQRKAVRSQRKAAQIERRTAEIQNTRARRQASREAIMAQAQSQARAGAVGGLGGSALQQQLASLQTQLGSNVAFQQTLERSNILQLEQMDRAAKYGQRASEWSALSSLAGQGMTLYSARGAGGESGGFTGKNSPGVKPGQMPSHIPTNPVGRGMRYY